MAYNDDSVRQRNDRRALPPQVRFVTLPAFCAEVAEAAGVREVTVHGIEAGRYKPTLDLAIRIARALGATLDDVARGA